MHISFEYNNNIFINLHITISSIASLFAIYSKKDYIVKLIIVLNITIKVIKD